MKDLLIKIKNFSIITIIASFVIGLVLLIWPNESITAVSILTGVTTILLGVTALIFNADNYTDDDEIDSDGREV